MNHRFIITGGPGSGKSTVLNTLSELGYRVELESARKIIKERLAAGLSPRPNPTSFANEVFREDIAKYQQTASGDIVFFDRGVLDALYMLSAESALAGDEIGRYVQR